MGGVMPYQIECVGGPLDGTTLELCSKRISSPYMHHEGWIYTYRDGVYQSCGHKRQLSILNLIKMLFVVIWFKVFPVYKGVRK